MAVRPPSQFKRPKLGDNPLAAALDQEILAEMAGTYGRLMRKLETALAALRAFDEAGELKGEKATEQREASATARRPVGAPTRSREGAARAGVSALETDGQSDSRDDLVRKAGEALWHVVIQRDVMRLSGTKQFLQELEVPAEVLLAMGVRKE